VPVAEKQKYVSFSFTFSLWPSLCGTEEILVQSPFQSINPTEVSSFLLRITVEEWLTFSFDLLLIISTISQGK
jgi:hypothetical protein